MISVPMQRIIRRSQALGISIVIPGEWSAQVVDILSEKDTSYALQVYEAYFVSCGMGVYGSHAAAKHALQHPYTSGYLDGLKEAVARRAEEYAQLYPTVQVVEGERNGQPLVRLAGFDPRVIQSAYVPNQRPGRGGQHFMKQIYERMHKEASNE